MQSARGAWGAVVTRCILGHSAPATRPMVKPITRGDSARRVGLVRHCQGLCKGGGKVVGLVGDRGRWGALGGFSMHFCLWSSNQEAPGQADGTMTSSALSRPTTLFPGCCMTVVGPYPGCEYPCRTIQNFRISKMGDIFACGAPTRNRVAKWM
jgi:hypothetical protein